MKSPAASGPAVILLCNQTRICVRELATLARPQQCSEAAGAYQSQCQRGAGSYVAFPFHRWILIELLVELLHADDLCPLNLNLENHNVQFRWQYTSDIVNSSIAGR